MLTDKLKIKKGEIVMTMRHANGLVERREMENVIVDNASLLMAELMKENSGVQGIMTLAVGTGDTGWDLQNPPIATASQTALFNELERKTFNSTTYIDSMGVPTITRTNKVMYETVFTAAEAVGALVEMGLFGGTGATAPLGGTMVNFHTFPVWNKSATATLTISWLLTF
ncbi:MAG: hypothetical protein Q7R33_01890 [Nitrosarchaeum sp.]|nr:hypothetical protein [Nitrosarchaeum sp.]